MERVLPLTPTQQNLLEIVTRLTFTQQNVLFSPFFFFFLTPVFLLFRKPLQENKTEAHKTYSLIGLGDQILNLNW